MKSYRPRLLPRDFGRKRSRFMVFGITNIIRVLSSPCASWRLHDRLFVEAPKTSSATTIQPAEVLPCTRMASQPRVRRRALACARCRMRKVQCDAQSPACTRCVEAGVPCVAMDSATKQAVPRSIAQYLETEIAEMERATSKKHLPQWVCSKL